LAQPAALPDVQDAEKNPALQLIRAELEELRFNLRDLVRVSKRVRHAQPSYQRLGFPIQSSKLLHQALEQLSAREAEMFLLSEGLEGRPPHTVEQIAEMMGTSPRVVERSLRHAEHKIRSIMARAPGV
jgi:DNA-directed RNA polymerase specialized sigma24 family protein